MFHIYNLFSCFLNAVNSFTNKDKLYNYAPIGMYCIAAPHLTPNVVKIEMQKRQGA